MLARVDAARLSRLLASLRDPALRSRRAAEVLGGLPAAEAIALLGELARRARRKTDPASAALEGALRGCHLHLAPEQLAALRAAAELAEEPELRALFSSAASPRAFDHDREVWVDRAMRAQPLGTRKQLARGRDRDALARLASDPDPSVLRVLLENPLVTEREVLVAASRRPTRAALLEEIFRSARWSQNRRVRRALALNPYSPPALAATSLALLTAPDLREVAGDATLAAEVRLQARLLLFEQRRAGEGK